jgi:hypothetical protein
MVQLLTAGRRHAAMRALRRLLATALLTVVIAGAAAAAPGQRSYTINGQRVTPEVAQFLADSGIPHGDYWLAAGGDWGVVGNRQPIGNIYGSDDPRRYDHSDCFMLCPDGTSGCWCPAQ